MELELWKILPLILIVAMLYSSVGHGGASGYLALMSLLGVSAIYMRSSALILNVLVSAISFYLFYRKEYFQWKLFYPFAIASVPMAFIGAGIIPDPVWYDRILGLFLIFAALRISGIFSKHTESPERKLSLPAGLITGAVLGFFSGMIGIGGGIILSPIILIFGWGNVKQTAAVSALFIFVNSVSGLIGLGSGNVNFSTDFVWWIAAAFTGGVIGSVWGSTFANNYILKNVLAFVIFFAALKLLVF